MTMKRRDIIRELEQACKRGGIAFGVYYSHALDWRDGGDSGMKGTEHRSKQGKKANCTAQDFWFTKKGDKLYVSTIVRPEGNTVSIKSLKGFPITGIKVLGKSGEVKWAEMGDAIEIQLPSLKADSMGYALEISV